jgi:DNA invertase Pin-like site-specific DNA recombinase
LFRQVLGAVAQFDKASTVAKLKAARDRKIAAGEKCGGRKSYAERDPEMVDLARWLRHNSNRPHSLRQVAAELAEYGFRGPSGEPYAAAAVASMLGE